MAHFHSFTADGMRRFGQELADNRAQRSEDNRRNRSEMLAGLADFRKRQSQELAERRRRTAEEAGARRRHLSELKAATQAFLGRCEQGRAEMAADHRAMAGEIAAARGAWRGRPR